MGKRRSGFTGLTRFLQSMDQHPNEPPIKRQKLEYPEPLPNSPLAKAKRTRDSSWVEKYDASGHVPHYMDVSEVPEKLLKYFSQRDRLLSLYSKHPGCLLDEEGWYSITPEKIADQIAERCRCDTILDAFCGVGGNAIAFAKTCQRVIAIDTSATRLALARHNAQIYGVADRIEFILGDYLSFARSYASTSNGHSGTRRKIDVVFLSPPWGGVDYLTSLSRPASPTKSASEPQAHPEFPLSAMQPVHGRELFEISRQITKNVAYYLPRNVNLVEVGNLIKERAEEKVEVEEEWATGKLKAVTCYFGGLADGQESLF
ncbi:S-adenosyl-L-methionine-dependent methyltransferase [Flagelloscypha sp. PMI_526]|nr:S-adenosyl-L-methionine-dependent methyltransferase [Flagelloscypha sp. PMI_526]